MFQRIFNLNSKIVPEAIFISFTHVACKVQAANEGK